jgi:2-keto-4-pentenoate hydratase
MSDIKETAAQHLVGARRAAMPGPGLPESCLPMDLETAVGVQERITELLGEPVGGWKCSVPKPDRIVVGPIYGSTIFRTSPCPFAASGAAARVEPEIAFVMGRALPPRSKPYAESEVLEAVAEARLVLELLASRYAEPKSRSFSEMLADSLQNLGLFVGPAVTGIPYPELPAAFPIKVEDPWGVLVSCEGKHPDGHPLAPLYWLANFLAARGGGLKPGDVVTTGSYAGVLEVPFATPLRFTYGGLGELAVNFSRK